jgi:hypothetical protein
MVWQLFDPDAWFNWCACEIDVLRTLNRVPRRAVVEPRSKDKARGLAGPIGPWHRIRSRDVGHRWHLQKDATAAAPKH